MKREHYSIKKTHGCYTLVIQGQKEAVCLSSHPPALAPPSASFWTPQLLWDWVIHHPPFNQTRQGQNYECLKIHCLFLPVKYMKVLLPSWHSPSSLRLPSPLYCAPWGHEQRKLKENGRKNKNRFINHLIHLYWYSIL